MWFLGMVNTLGAWSGDIFSLPEQVAMANTDFGMSFFATSYQDPAVMAQFQEAIVSAEQETEIILGMENSNNAEIVNNVNVGAYTGNNGIVATEVERSRIVTGNARALSNILNFANTNLINADLYIGLTNIFGSWNGNIVFGYPDLAVEQTLLQGNFPEEEQSQVNYSLDISNEAGSTMRGTSLEWQYNPEQMNLQSVDSDYTYTQTAPGKLLFDIGTFGPNAQDTIQIQLQTTETLDEGDEIETFAHIYGTGPERNLINNQSVLHAIVEDEVNEVPSLPTTQNENNQNNQENTNQPNENPQGNQPQLQNQNPAPSAGSPGSLAVTKTNNSGGRALEIGDEVSFTISVKNTGTTMIHNVIVYDTLSTPDGEVIYSENFDIGTVSPGENVSVEYDLGITKAVPGGTYTNSAQAQGLGLGLQSVRSTTATSSFKVAKPKVLAEVVTEEAPKNEEPAPVLPQDFNQSKPVITSAFEDNFVRSAFQGSKSFNSLRSRGSGSVAGLSVNQNADAQSITSGNRTEDNSENAALFPEASAKSEERKLPISNTVATTLVMAVLMGLGYTIASYRDKKKLLK